MFTYQSSLVLLLNGTCEFVCAMFYRYLLSGLYLRGLLVFVLRLSVLVAVLFGFV